jgi:hypothetical protein
MHSLLVLAARASKLAVTLAGDLGPTMTQNLGNQLSDVLVVFPHLLVKVYDRDHDGVSNRSICGNAA